MRNAAQNQTYGTLDLYDNVFSGCNLLAFGWETDLSALGKGRDGEESEGEEELHFRFWDLMEEDYNGCTEKDEVDY